MSRNDEAAPGHVGNSGAVAREEAWITLRQAALLTDRALHAMRRWVREEKLPRKRAGHPST